MPPSSTRVGCSAVDLKGTGTVQCVQLSDDSVTTHDCKFIIKYMCLVLVILLDYL